MVHKQPAHRPPQLHKDDDRPMKKNPRVDAMRLFGLRRDLGTTG